MQQNTDKSWSNTGCGLLESVYWETNMRNIVKNNNVNDLFFSFPSQKKQKTNSIISSLILNYKTTQDDKM